VDLKVRPIGRWLRAHGASPANPATVAIGFSTDEVHRCKRKKAQPCERPAYPLVDLGPSRADCDTIIADAGLPVPDAFCVPRTACRCRCRPCELRVGPAGGWDGISVVGARGWVSRSLTVACGVGLRVG
jgi:hypothetical protein